LGCISIFGRRDAGRDAGGDLKVAATGLTGESMEGDA
jgi:hypothetical protein